MREIRRGQSSDLPALTLIFWRGVHEGAAPHYTSSQRAAWLPRQPDPAALGARLEDQTVLVAAQEGVPVGFITRTPAGHIDLLYVLPEMRGGGAADALWVVMLNDALNNGLAGLTTRASDMARSFFVRNGWSVVADAPQTRAGVVIGATDMAIDLMR